MKRYVVNIVVPLVFVLVAGFIGYSKFVNAPPAPRPPAADNRPVKRILFIGNSYTYTHNMPGMIPLIARSVEGEPYRYETETVAEGGRQLIEHASGRELVNKVHRGGYDVVVLQEQSQTPLFTDGALNSMTAIEFFAKVAKGGKAEPVIYGTWARRGGDAFYGSLEYSNIRPPRSPVEMTRRLDDFFRKASARAGAGYLPVGRYWWNVTQQHPGLDLYDADGSHPNMQGAYLTALLFYRYLSGNSPAKARWAPPGVPEGNARLLREIASQ